MIEFSTSPLVLVFPSILDPKSRRNSMRLVTFSDAKGMRVGVHDAASNTIVDLAATTRLPKDMTAFIALGKNGLKRARAAVKSGDGRLAFEQRQTARADPAPGEEHPVRRQELFRSCPRISRERRRCERRQGCHSRRADPVHQVAEFGDRQRRADTELSRLHQFHRLRRRADGGDRPRRARHQQAGRIRSRLRLYHHQRRHRAHAAEPAQAVVSRQKPRRLLSDGAVHRHRRRSARRRPSCA